MELLEQFTHGELEAFETLFRQHQQEVYSWIVRIVRNPALAEDLTIETFWRIYRARARFDPARSFGAWARRIATNVAIDHLKSARHEVELRSDIRAPAQAEPGTQTELRKAITIAFRALPAKLQAAATLALVEERPHDEVGEALGISTSAVKSRVFRATRLLRKSYNEWVLNHERNERPETSRSAESSDDSDDGHGTEARPLAADAWAIGR